MLQIVDLHKSFENIKILKGINATFEPGQTSLIIGQSGSGKTVLIKCLLDLYKYDKGNIIYGQENFSNLSDIEKMKLKSKIGTVFQGSALFDSMNIEENVMFPLKMFKEYTHEEMLEKANEIRVKRGALNIQDEDIAVSINLLSQS